MAELTRARPKARSRAGGAAVPLDDLDRRLLNLLQGSFPLEPRPFARVAEAAEVSEDEVLSRTQRLIDERAAAMESLTSIRRAGADMIITYFAKDAAAWMRERA